MLSSLIITVSLFIIGIYWPKNPTEPKYRLLQSNGDIQIREYPGALVIKTILAGRRKNSLKLGFKTLHSFISGGNARALKIPMCLPILCREADQVNPNLWEIKLIIPDHFSEDLLRDIIPDNITLERVPPAIYAVQTFPGYNDDIVLDGNLLRLNQYLTKKKLQAVGKPFHAFYNSPWSLPYLRRNEVLIEINQNF